MRVECGGGGRPKQRDQELHDTFRKAAKARGLVFFLAHHDRCDDQGRWRTPEHKTTKSDAFSIGPGRLASRRVAFHPG